MNPWLEINKKQMRRDWLATSGPYWCIAAAIVALTAVALAAIA